MYLIAMNKCLMYSIIFEENLFSGILFSLFFKMNKRLQLHENPKLNNSFSTLHHGASSLPLFQSSD